MGVRSITAEFESPPTLAEELIEQGVDALRLGTSALKEGVTLQAAAKLLSRPDPALSTRLFELAAGRFDQSWFANNGAIVAIELYKQQSAPKTPLEATP